MKSQDEILEKIETCKTILNILQKSHDTDLIAISTLDALNWVLGNDDLFIDSYRINNGEIHLERKRNGENPCIV